MRTREIKDNMDTAPSVTIALLFNKHLPLKLCFQEPQVIHGMIFLQSTTYCPQQMMKPNPVFLTTTSPLLYAYNYKAS